MAQRNSPLNMNSFSDTDYLSDEDFAKMLAALTRRGEERVRGTFEPPVRRAATQINSRDTALDLSFLVDRVERLRTEDARTMLRQERNAWLDELQVAYDRIKDIEAHYAAIQRTLNAAPPEYKQESNVVSAEMRNQTQALRQSKHKVKQMLDKTASGQMEMMRGGLSKKNQSYLESGMQLATLVGMANPAEAPGQNITEEAKPPGDETLDAPTTTIETVASRIELAGPVVQDTVSKQFVPQDMDPGQDGYKAELANWTYAKLAERPTIVRTWTWDAGQSTGIEIGHFSVPDVLKNPESITTSVFRQYAFCRWKWMEINVHANTNQFMMGRCCLASIPTKYYADGSSNYIRAITSNRADMNAAVMSQPSLVIPWTYNDPWMQTTALSTGVDDVLSNSFTVAMFVILPLKGTEGDSPSIPLRVTMSIHGLELACPIAPNSVAPFQGYDADTFATGQAGDEQNDNASVVYFPRSNAFANYEPGTMAQIHCNEMNEPTMSTQTSEDTMDVKTFVERPGIESYFSWKVNDQPGDLLLSQAVTPLLPDDLPTPSVPLAYLARFAAYWNGSIRYRLDWAKSIFHTGKLVMVAVPEGATATSSNYLAFNHIVVDLKEDSTLDFDVAFVSQGIVKRVFSNGMGSEIAGATLEIRVHTKLQTNASMQSTIDCALWKSAGPSLRLFNIRQPSFASATLYTLTLTQGLTGNGVQMAPQPGGGVLRVFRIGRDLIANPATIPDGVYTADTPFFINISGSQGNFTWSGTVLYVINGWIRNETDIPANVFVNNAMINNDQVTIVRRGVRDFATGQTGNVTAMHDKGQLAVPLLGSENSAFRPIARFEPITSLLQILERPHTMNVAASGQVQRYAFRNQTDEIVDSFDIFSNCFAFTSGSVQWMIIGADVIQDTTNNLSTPELLPSRLSYLFAGMRIPTEEGHVLLFDTPPAHRPLMCSNLRPAQKAGELSAIVIREKPGLTVEDVALYVRAGEGFRYHMWAGIPTPSQQTVMDRTPKERHDFHNDAMKTLRRKINEKLMQRPPLPEFATGQCDEAPKKKNSFAKRRAKIMETLRRTRHAAPKTENHVKITTSTGEAGEASEEDDEFVDTVTSESEASSSKDTKPLFQPLSQSRLVPKPVHQVLQTASETMSSLQVTSSQMQASLEDIRNVVVQDGREWLQETKRAVKATTTNINKAADKVVKISEKGHDAIHSMQTSGKEAISDFTDQIKSDGLFSALFGTSGENSRLIQVLLIDALECVAIRKPAKWIGMLVKIGISMGLTRGVINMILRFFKDKTKTSEQAPHENQQEFADGQAFDGIRSDVVCSLVSVIVMFISFSVSGGMKVNKKKTETMWDWIAERARQVNAIDRGMESLFKLFDKINSWVVKCVVKFFPLVNDDLHSSLREKKFLKLGKEILTLATPLLKVTTIVKIFADADMRKMVIDIDAQYCKFLEYGADPDISKKHGQIFNRVNFVCKELRARIISLVDTSSVRIDPFHISFYGWSGAGKSYLASTVAYVLGRSQNIPAEDLFYPRTPNMEFWDNYRCQEFIGIDDVDQQDTEELAGEMITLKSNVPKVLPMAHLETKGCVFSSRGIITTTNIPYPEPTSIKHKTAYKRRRNVLIECVQLAEEQQMDHSHMAFVVRHSVKAGTPPLTEPMNFPELMAYLAPKYSQYLRMQHRLVQSVAPDTKFKPLYVYDDSAESLIKISEIVNELFTKNVNCEDMSIKPISEIVTTRVDDWTYPDIDKYAGTPEDFTETLDAVPPNKMTVEASDVEFDDQYEEDFEGDENALFAEGQAGDDDYKNPFDDEDEEEQVGASRPQPAPNPFENEDGEVIDDEEEQPKFVKFEEMAPETREYLSGMFATGEEQLTITQELSDLIYVLSNSTFGTEYHKNVMDLPAVPIPHFPEMCEKYNRYMDKLRKMKNWMYRDGAEEQWHELCISMEAYHYYVLESQETTVRKRRLLCYAMCGLLFTRGLVTLYKLVGEVLKEGLLSRWIRNVNNRLLPPSFVNGIQVEVYRTVTEACLTPWCVLQRIIYEARRMIISGILYITRFVANKVMGEQGPELHQVVKVGCFLIGGYLLYRAAKFGKKWLSSKDEEAQRYLTGEADDNSNLSLPILGKTHAGIPEDGESYEHHHQCERCRLIFRHKHAKTQKSITHRLLCKMCGRKERDRRAKNMEEALTTEDDHDMVDNAVGEAVLGSGTMPKDRFRKRANVRKATTPKPIQKVAIGESYLSRMFPSFMKGKVEETRSREGEEEVAVGEASDDAQYLAVRPVILNNCVSLHVGSRKLNGIILKGKWMVTVAHIFHNCNSRSLAYAINWKGQFYHGALDTTKHLRWCEDVEIGGKKYTNEVVFVNLVDNKTLPSFRDIRMHLPTEKAIELILQQDGVLCIKDREGSNFIIEKAGKIHMVVDRKVKTKFHDSTAVTAVETAWLYNADCEKGSCGSPLLCKNPQLTTKLIGFHFSSYDGTSMGMAFPLFREFVDEMLSEDDFATGLCETGEIEQLCEEVYDCFPEDLPQDHKLTLVPQGRVLILGKLKREWTTSLPRRTDIITSPFYDQIYPHTTEPAILNDRDPRTPGDIIQRGINKFGNVHQNKRPRTIMREVVRHKVRQHIALSTNTSIPLKTLSWDEAINGIVGQKFMPGIRMDTSPGFPYVRQRPTGESGRAFLFEKLEDRSDGSPRYKPKPALQADLDEIWNALKERRIVKNYYLDTLKDERRSHARLYKTRFFNVHNVAWLIVHRRLYLALQAFRLEQRFKVGSALGLDMHGTEATSLINHLHEKGDKFLPSDFGQWDGNAAAEDIADKFLVDEKLMEMFDTRNAKTNPSEETPAVLKVMRQTVSDAANDRICIVQDTVYRSTQGVPSGRGDTSDTNTQVHDQLNYANWIELHIVGKELEKATCEQKDVHTAEVAVGDDGGATVDDESCHIYNNLNIANIFKHYGYDCTPPTKDNSEHLPWVDIDDFQFLKCTFERDEQHHNFWHMKMAKKVIFELTNWTTSSGDPYDLFYDNMDDATRFLFHYGKEEFDDFIDRVNDVLEQHHRPILPHTYEEMYDEWIERFNLE